MCYPSKKKHLKELNSFRYYYLKTHNLLQARLHIFKYKITHTHETTKWKPVFICIRN